METKKILLIISYDGSEFFGWQENSQNRTVEKELRKALEKILGHSLILEAASRTDAKVHATGQVVTFLTHQTKYSLEEIHYRLNCVLPFDLVVSEIQEKPLAFHPTNDAQAKTYLYQISTAKFLNPFLRKTVWHFPYSLDRENMQKVAKTLEGTHDFSAFSNQRKDLKDKEKIRTLFKVDIEQADSLYFIKITGDRFLYRMARNIVGTLCYVGSGKITLETIIPQLFTSPNRVNMGITAPPCGLFLEKVYYDRQF